MIFWRYHYISLTINKFFDMIQVYNNLHYFKLMGEQRNHHDI